MKFDHELLNMVAQITNIESYIDFVQILNVFLVKKYVNMCFGIAIDPKLKNQILRYFEYVVKIPDPESDSAQSEPWFVSNLLAYVLGKTSIEQKVWQQIRLQVEEIYAKRDKGGCNNSLLFMISDADTDSGEQYYITFISTTMPQTMPGAFQQWGIAKTGGKDLSSQRDLEDRYI